jgi:hypothetical protein
MFQWDVQREILRQLECVPEIWKKNRSESRILEFMITEDYRKEWQKPRTAVCATPALGERKQKNPQDRNQLEKEQRSFMEGKKELSLEVFL